MKRNILPLLAVLGLTLSLGALTGKVVSIETAGDTGGFTLLEGWSYEGKLIDAGYLFDVTVVQLDDGRYRLYGEDASQPERTVVSYISADGLDFQLENGSRLIGAGLSPFILKLPEGGFRLYYAETAGFPGTGNIGSFVSDDGLNFTLEAGNRLTYSGSGYEAHGVTGAKVIQLANGSYRMYYIGRDGNDTDRELSALSPDAVNWTRESGVRINTSGSCSGSGLIGIGDGGPIIDSEGTYHLYTAALRCNDGFINGIWDFTSSDGLTFTLGSTPLIGGYTTDSNEVNPEDTAVIMINSEIRVYFAPYGTQGSVVPESGIHSVIFNGTSYTTTTTIDDDCSLPGDYDPCNQVSLAEVIDFITLWATDGATLAGVIDLITAWATG